MVFSSPARVPEECQIDGLLEAAELRQKLRGTDRAIAAWMRAVAPKSPDEQRAG